MSVNQHIIHQGELLKRLIEDSADKSVNPANVAESLGVSPTYIYEIFKKADIGEKHRRRLKDKYGFDLNIQKNQKHASSNMDTSTQTKPARWLSSLGENMFKEYAQFFGVVAETIEAHEGSIRDHESKLDEMGEEIADLQGTRLQIYGRLETIERQLKIVHHD